MGPRDHRIHLGRMDSPNTPPQHHSSTKQLFFWTIFRNKNVPKPKCHPKIFPEADFGNFPKSLRKMRTANPSEMLSRIPPSKLKMEPRGKTHIFRVSNEKPWGAAIWDQCSWFRNICFSSLIPYTLIMPGVTCCCPSKAWRSGLSWISGPPKASTSTCPDLSNV